MATVHQGARRAFQAIDKIIEAAWSLARGYELERDEAAVALEKVPLGGAVIMLKSPVRVRPFFASDGRLVVVVDEDVEIHGFEVSGLGITPVVTACSAAKHIITDVYSVVRTKTLCNAAYLLHRGVAGQIVSGNFRVSGSGVGPFLERLIDIVALSELSASKTVLPGLPPITHKEVRLLFPAHGRICSHVGLKAILDSRYVNLVLFLSKTVDETVPLVLTKKLAATPPLTRLVLDIADASAKLLQEYKTHLIRQLALKTVLRTLAE